MCGLCGGRFAPRAEHDATVDDVLRRMTRIQAHRGPDDEGFHAEGNLRLGFRRLSIIDLDRGHQPIANENGTVWVVLNGEIYNFKALRADLETRGHRFATAADSEVVAHLYEERGPEAFCALNGMFAIAVIDVARRRLVLARDRAGVKPLYFTRTGRDFLFASEVKALLEHPGVRREIDPDALASYLETQYVPGPRTIFQGIECLPPGHRLVLDEGQEPVVDAYWTLPSLSNDGLFTDRDACAAELGALVRDAVQMRLVADVPLGALLSGGLDSSIVVGVMAERATGPVETFAVGYREGGPMDERASAAFVARHFGTRHHEIVLGPEDAFATLPRLVWHNELPVAEPLLVPSFFLFKESRRHVTVVLSGEGADELFGGYRRYRALSELRRLRGLMPPAEWAGWAQLKRRSGRFATLGKVGEAAAQASAAEALWQWQSVFGRDELRRLLPGASAQAHSGARAYRTADGFRDDVPIEELANVLMEIEINNRLVSFILERADKMSMANSLELRTPFLDYRLLELSRRIPARWKLDATGEKRILRAAFRDLLPEPVRRRRKRAFQSPYTSWLPALSEALLPESRLVKDGWLAGEPVRSLAAAFSRSERRAKQLWTVLMLEMWYRIFLAREELPALGPRPARPATRQTPAPTPR